MYDIWYFIVINQCDQAQKSSNSQLGYLKQNFTQAILKLIPSFWFSKIMLLAALIIYFKFSGKCFQAISLCSSDTDENDEASKNAGF